MYPYATGLKTGYTKAAGRCLVSSAEKDGVKLICVTLNAPDDWNDHMHLFEYGFSHVSMTLDLENVIQVKDKLFMVPDAGIDMKGYRVLRSGLYLGDLKKNRFEPSQSLAMALKKEEFDQIVDFPVEDARVKKYLKGETIEIEDTKKSGWQLICVDGYPLGWAKAAKGKLKNKYHSGWRMF